jgi:glucose/mannose-6-phosphate isomerase
MPVNISNLDDLARMRLVDQQDMLGQIDGLPAQLEKAWQIGQTFPLPDAKGVKIVVISGMGGSAIGADLLGAYTSPLGNVPVFIHRDYDLPAWANGPEILVIASSHSGNTEETLSSFEAAKRNGCKLLVISTGGELTQRAKQAGAPVWTFEHQGQPRSAVGYSFGLLLAAFARMGFIPDPATDLAEAVAAMRTQQEHLVPSVLVKDNPAKRSAGQFVGRFVSVIGSGHLAPVARRWKGQISEVAKAWAQFEALPEADHNTLAGLVNPEQVMNQLMVVFLSGAAEHPRNRLRGQKSWEIFMVEGVCTDTFTAAGKSALAQMWTALHFGDYLAYYLAMIYEVDPTPVGLISNLKEAMKK